MSFPRANLEGGGQSGAVGPSSAGGRLCPASPWEPSQRLSSRLDCELLKGRDRALCLCGQFLERKGLNKSSITLYSVLKESFLPRFFQ